MNVMHNGCVEYCSPVRNRYFYGKLLDVFHFELEQNYFNTKRWLLNRFVSGYGVVRGMNVVLGPDGQSVYVTPGLAIDKCGREIIVCNQSATVPLPPPPHLASTGGSGAPSTPAPVGTVSAAVAAAASDPNAAENCGCGKFVHLLLCYHECPADPVPALGGDCDTQAMCSPGAIHERYELKIVDGRLAAARTTSMFQIPSNGTISYKTLSDYVRGLDMPEAGCDCCIPLANIELPLPGKPYTIDTSVAPIVYSNDLLYELFLALKQGPIPQSTQAKP